MPRSPRPRPERFVSDDDIVGGRIHVLYERLVHDDYEGALMVAERLITREPEHPDALQCRDMCVAELTKLYVSRLGSLDRVPQLSVEAAEVRPAAIGALASRVVQHVNGLATLADVVRASHVPRLEALRILSELYLGEVIELADD